MPTYEYQCTRCGKITEEFKPVTARRRQRCPACRGKVAQLISGGLGVHFKGSGFYINDSRTKNGPVKADEGSPPSATAADNASDNSSKAD